MIPTISPTQIDTWRTCKRKFAFTYLAGLPRTPSTKAQLIGIDLHGKVEDYLKTGKYDVSGGKDADRLFPFLLPYLPPAGTPAEQKITVTLQGLQFGGKFDWWESGKEIGDLKTTSNLVYSKSEKELAEHPQPLIYMKATGEHHGRWVYVQTKGSPKVKPVEFEADFTALDGVISDGYSIADAWEKKGTQEPNSFPPNTSACDMYGGCPFKMQCHVSAGDRLIALLHKEKPMVDINADLENLLASIQAPTAAPIPGQAINPPTPPAPETAPLDQTATAPLTTPTEPAKPKRGRPRKNPEAAPAEDNGPTTERDPRPIGTLYVSCMPIGQDFLLADSVFATARAKVAEKTGLEDYRLADFGKGAAGLLLEVQELINGLRPDSLVIEDGGPEARVCLSALVAMSRNVVRGF